MISESKTHKKVNGYILSPEELVLKRIALLSFKAWELEFYLKINTHDLKAKEILENYKSAQRELKAKYFINK